MTPRLLSVVPFPAQELVFEFVVTETEDKQYCFMNDIKLVSIARMKIGLLDLKSLQDTSANELGKSLEVVNAALMLGEAVVFKKVGTAGDETSIVIPKIISCHIVELLGTCSKSLKVLKSVPVF